MAASTIQQIGADLQALLGQLGGDVLGALSTGLATYSANLLKSPTAANVIAQTLGLVVSAPLQAPMMETTAITQFATTVGNIATLLNPPKA